MSNDINVILWYIICIVHVIVLAEAVHKLPLLQHFWEFARKAPHAANTATYRHYYTSTGRTAALPVEIASIQALIQLLTENICLICKKVLRLWHLEYPLLVSISFTRTNVCMLNSSEGADVLHVVQIPNWQEWALCAAQVPEQAPHAMQILEQVLCGAHKWGQSGDTWISWDPGTALGVRQWGFTCCIFDTLAF